MVNGEGVMKREVRGDSEAVYLVCLVYLVCFVPQPNEPKKPNEPERPDRPAPRHAPRDVGLQNLALILHAPFFIAVRRLLDKAVIQRRPSYQIDNCFLSCNVRRGWRMTRRI